jgi:hypothetical protein
MQVAMLCEATAEKYIYTKLIEVTHVFRLFQHVYIYIMHIIGIDISYLQLMFNKSLSGVIN